MERARVEWNGQNLTVAVDIASDLVTRWGAQKILRDAQRFCPEGKVTRVPKGLRKSWTGRVPGTLRNSIKIRRSRYKGGGYIVKAGNYDAYYVHFVELGTPGKIYRVGKRKGERRTPIEAKPFMKPAKELNEMPIHIKFREELRRQGIR